MKSLLTLLAPIALAVLPAASAFSAPEPQPAPDKMVDALNTAFGKQTTNRAVHSKGVVLEGRFTPAPSATSVSQAPHFRQAVPITVRFSDFAGIPTIPDTHDAASPRGLAVKFHLPDGSVTDIVTHSFNGFPTRNSEEFRQLMIAIGTSGPGVAKPTPLDRFLGDHPVAKTFLTTQPPPPVSFATIGYFGVNSFKFTNAQGQARFGRYRIEAVAGNQFLSPEQVAKAAPGYLDDEIRARVAQGPVRFRFRVQLSGPGDVIDDPSIAWPETREIIDLGEIEITRVDADSATAERQLIFMPATLPAGIEPADPMILVRQGAYPISYARRHQ